MFNLCFADLVQLRFPLGVLGEIIGGARGEEDMSGVAAVHHPLRNVYSGTGQVRLVVYILDRIDRPAVDSHS